MKTLLNFPLVFAVAVLSFNVGCTKKRTASLPYGADRDLMTISQYDGKEFPLKTGKLQSQANAGSIKVQDARTNEKAKVRNFDYVEYESQDPLNLTDNTAMLGRPGFTYKVRYVFSGNLLKVMKVAKEEDLATDEVASSEDAGQNLRMVPIVSYSVTYFSIDTTRNDLKEKTSKLELVAQSGKSSSTHFKVDLNSKTRAVFLSKRTVLPANYFTIDGQSDWYFAFTVVSQNYNENRGILGNILASDKYGREAFKVRARKVEDKILFYNLGIDDRLEKTVQQRLENQAIVFTLPVEYTDYRMSESGKTSSVKEEAVKEKAWDKRAFTELKLKDIKVPIADLDITELKDVQLDDGYFSFLVQSEAVGGLIRVSLLNTKQHEDLLIKAGAQPYKNLKKIYFQKDRDLFGFFTTTVESLDSYDRSKTNQAEKLTFINRFNPTRKDIEFRLNNEAPEWMEEIVRVSAKAWNAAFNSAGSQINIRVTADKENKGKILRGSAGDLRYSLINMYGEVDEAGPWGGFGPVLNDPQTGEIIMATANINVTNRVEGMQKTLNNYILAMKGELQPKYIGFIPENALPSLKPVVDVANKTIQFANNKISSLKNNLMYIYDAANRKYLKGLKVVEPATKAQLKLNISNQFLLEESFQEINGNIVEQVKNVCPTLANYAESLKSANATRNEETEVKLVKACAIELSKPSLISVILHEMGHNFGLRHNFYGSTDQRNFYAPVDLKLGNTTVKTKWESSSIMDYTSINYENMIHPGLYDVAAIRWGYTDQIEDQSRKIVKVSPHKSTRDQVQSNYHLYKYCSDENVDAVVTDPMCARSDYGTDPTQVVDYLIKSYDSSFALWNHRHNRDKMMDMEEAAIARMKNYLTPMAKFYEKWRLILAAQAGPGKEYLESLQNREEYDALVAKVLDKNIVGERNAILNKQYKDAVQRIFEFLMKIAFLPDYSCITERTVNGKPTIQMFPFAKIQKNIFSTGTEKTVTSCQDKEVKNYLQTVKGAKVFAEAGYSFDNIYSNLQDVRISPRYEAESRPEILGTAQDRVFAIVMLIQRTSMLYHSQYTYQYAPNFMDELPFREALTKKVVERLTSGVPIQEVGLDKALQQELPPIVSPLFETEKPLLSLMFEALRFGQAIPGKAVETNQRLEKYAVVPYYMLDGENNPECAPINGFNWCATDLHPISKSLLKKLKSLQQMKASFKIDDSIVEKFTELTKDLVPQKGQAAQLDITFVDKVEERIKAVAEKEPAVAEKLILLMQVVFGPEYSIWQQGVRAKMKKLESEDLSVKETSAKLQELKKLKIRELAERIGVDMEKYKALDSDTFKERLTKFVEKVKDDAEIYAADPTELDAQADIILEALIGGRSN